MSFGFGLAMQCRIKREVKLKIGLYKKCKCCGHSNDLSTIPFSVDMPLCFMCGKPLWKSKKWYMKLCNNNPGAIIQGLP